MSTAELVVATSEEMTALGERLGTVLRRGDLVVLSGGLGAGKTTLTRGIGAGMRVRGPVTSPTFVLSRVHPSVGGAGVPLIHVDAYRLGSALELLDLDLDFEGAAVVVEWGEGLLDGVADSWLLVRIERATGAGPAAAPSGGDVHEWRAADHESPATGAIPRHSAEDFETEFDGDAPRTVRLEGRGADWAGLRGLA